MRLPSKWALAALAVLLGLQLGASTAWAQAPTAINVATFNLRLNLQSDGSNAWPQRRAAVLALIRYHEFDVMGTQEGLPEQIRDLAAMEEFAYVGVGRDDGKSAGEHAALFFRRARFDLLAHGDFWLSETPDRPSKGWDARCCNRLVTWARLADRVTGQRLLVSSAHFDHEGEVARRESAKLLLRWLAEHREAGDRVIAMGDLNATPESEPVRLMRAELSDARELSLAAPYGPTASFNGFRFGAAPEALIDYIFVDRGIEVLKYAVLSDSVDGTRYPSDHFPVVARLRVKSR